MTWPEWLSSSSTPSSKEPKSDNPKSALYEHNSSTIPQTQENDLNPTITSQYLSPETLAASTVTAIATLILARFYRRNLRRIPNVAHLPPTIFRRRSVYGYVTSVGDGDNFRIFHTPGGKLAGWGWFPGRRPQDLQPKALKDRTLHVRIAGVDAPEMAHFGRPEQPFSREALERLRGDVLRRYVRVWPYRRDQYDRVVCTVYRRTWGFWRSDVGLKMLKRGLATVYEAKFGSEFGNKEAIYRAAEKRAKERKVGMWQEPGFVSRMLGKKKELYESPREYKTRMAKEESAK